MGPIGKTGYFTTTSRWRNINRIDIFQGEQVTVYDPWVNIEKARREYGITPVKEPIAGSYDAIFLAVAHHQFKEMGAAAIRALGKRNHILYDLKHVLRLDEAGLRL